MYRPLVSEQYDTVTSHYQHAPFIRAALTVNVGLHVFMTIFVLTSVMIAGTEDIANARLCAINCVRWRPQSERIRGRATKTMR